jgi:purine nucleoside phosphorylase
VGRVIARPFEGRPGSFVRTKDRKDFSLEPPQRTYLDLLAESGVPTIGLGKIFQIYAGRGVAEEHKVSSNDDNLHKLLALLGEGRQGLIMTNLVDFDMTWGHRNDLEGFAGGLVAVERALPRIVELLRPEDRLLITADHGVDPTTVSTDHSREYVPLLYYPRPAQAPDACYEGYMCDTGASAYDHLAGAQASLPGAPVERLQPARGWRRYPPVLPGECGLPCAAGPEEAQKAAVYIGSRLGPAPGVAVILGSGLDVFVHALAVEGEVEYADVPGWPSSAVVGHRGSLLVGELNGTRLAVLRGRSHAYEGPDRSELQLAVRTLVRWGVRMLVLTNASGGLDPDLAPGSLLTVERILDFQLPASDGHPAVWDCGNPRVAGVLAELPRVVYAALPGPQYETAAEVEVLRGLGADVVGMSTAAEAAAALDEGLDLAVLSVVTNPAGRTASGRDEVHREVLDVGLAAAPRLAAVLERLIGALER